MDNDTLDQQTTESPAPRPKAAPIESRFMYVDIAAMRAKQLRRGALPRIDDADEHGAHKPLPLKAERIAMEEVRRGLVQWEVPDLIRPHAGHHYDQ